MSATGSGIPANREALVAGGPAPLRELVLGIVEAGVRAADPEAAVRAAVSLGEGGAVIVDGVSHVPGPGGRVLVLGAGKASARIATTLEQLLGDVIAGGVVVAPEGHAASLDRIELLVSRPPAADRGQLPCGAAADAAGRDRRARGRGAGVLHRRQLGAGLPAGRRRQLRGEARAAPAAAGIGRRHPRDQRRAKARVRAEGRPARRRDGRCQRRQPDRVRRGRRPAGRDHRPHGHRHHHRRAGDRGAARVRSLGCRCALDPAAPDRDRERRRPAARRPVDPEPGAGHRRRRGQRDGAAGRPSWA